MKLLNLNFQKISWNFIKRYKIKSKIISKVSKNFATSLRIEKIIFNIFIITKEGKCGENGIIEEIFLFSSNIGGSWKTLVHEWSDTCGLFSYLSWKKVKILKLFSKIIKSIFFNSKIRIFQPFVKISRPQKKIRSYNFFIICPPTKPGSWNLEPFETFEKITRH